MGWPVVAEFKDAKTGTDGNRPGYQAMMDAALYGEAPFDVIVVHSYSRFFRDEIEGELSIRSLEHRGIELVSVTQKFERSPLGNMIRRILGLFDEYDSKETGKHVSRGMEENARQGFYNGGIAPFGYHSVEVEKRGETSKKKLQPCEDEAETVRLFFDLYLRGDGTTGPLGVKKIVEWLNDRGYRTRRDAKWGIGPLHHLLKDPVYKGDYWQNRSADKEDQILVRVPPIVSAEVFDAVQANLAKRNPKKTPPRTVSGPILLTGLIICATCGCGMIMGTGKSGRYRYYTCGGRVRHGKGTCPGRRIRMSDTDDLVIEAIMRDLLNQARMAKFLKPLRDRQNARDDKKASSLASNQQKLSDAEAKLRRLFEMIEKGLIDLDDPTFQERLTTARAERDIAPKAYESTLAELSPQARITEEKIAAFVELLRKNLERGPVESRRAYLRAVIDTIEIDDAEIRIHGRRDRLEQAILRQEFLPAGVPTFVREWRSGRPP